jgi:integrase
MRAEEVVAVSWIETLDSGRYRAVYRDETGKRRSKSFDRKADARDWLASERTDRARGQWVDPRDGKILVSAWAEQWLALRTVRRSTAAGDWSRYRNQLGPAFGGLALKDITPLRVKAFVAELAARLLVAAGVPIKAIQEQFGHASIVMTMDRYGHLLPCVDAALLRAVDDGLFVGLKAHRPWSAATRPPPAAGRTPPSPGR